MKLAVTGGRNTKISDEDFAWLVRVYDAVGGDGFILGDCKTGVDYEAWQRLLKTEYPFERYQADWGGLGLKAGPMRNGRMVADADALAAFHGGKGTADCTEQAKKKPIPIFVRR